MKETVIIAGVTRSGLTATMQMLHAGGFPCAGTHPAFEDFPMGQTPWSECHGKAVKLVDSHHHFPPTGDYRVIRLQRNLTEQAKSFNKWCRLLFGAAGAPLPRVVASLERDYRIIDEWASQQKAVLRVHFEDIVACPRLVAQTISSFVGTDLDVEAMVKVIVPRNAKCYPGLLELSM